MNTGAIVRQAARQVLVITDHGRPLVTLHPFEAARADSPLPNRERWIAKLPRLNIDSTALIGEERTRP